MFSRESFATKSKLVSDCSPDSLVYIPSILNEFITFINNSHGDQEWFSFVQNQIETISNFFYPSKKLPYSLINLFSFIEKRSQEIAEDLLQKAYDTTTASAKLTKFVKEELLQRYLTLTTPLILSQLQKRIQPLKKIMIYGDSPLIVQAILELESRDLEIVVIDSNPGGNAEKAAILLKNSGFSVEYSILNCVNHLFNGVSLLLIRAEAAFIDGAIISDAGSSIISMLAKFHGTPVAAVCESIRFAESVSTDFTESSVKVKSSEKCWFTNIVKNSENSSEAELIQAQWDLISSDLIDCLVTEMGPIPPSSVPVILKEYAAQ